MIVTIDGPAGAGKSTVAKTIAARLGYLYLDTGALYRAVAWKALATGTDPTAPVAMKRLCQEIQLKIAGTPDGGMEVEVDGRRLTEEIRTPEVTRAAAQVAAIPGIRDELLPIQQAFGRRTDMPGVVAEGRDLGTIIFPVLRRSSFSTRIRPSGHDGAMRNYWWPARLRIWLQLVAHWTPAMTGIKLARWRRSRRPKTPS